MEISDGYAPIPEQSTLALVCHHPQAGYYGMRNGRLLPDGSPDDVIRGTAARPLALRRRPTLRGDPRAPSGLMRGASRSSSPAGSPLAGCGSSGDDDAVRQRVTDYLTAFAAGDGTKACARMTVPLQETIMNALPHASDCIEAVAQLDNGPDDDRGELSIDGIVVDGETARASVAMGGDAGTRHTLRRVDGDWRVDVSPTEG